MHNLADIGSTFTSRMCEVASIVAAGAGDNTEVDGVWIDRQGYSAAKLVIFYETVLAAAATLSIAANMQDASTSGGTGAADYGTALANAVVATGPGGGGTVRGVVELDVNLQSADRYVRAQFTPNLSAGSVDTAIVGAILILGGGDKLPAV